MQTDAIAKIVKPAILVLVIVVALALVSTAQVPETPAEEYLLLGNATRGAGEPMLAVDPTNPRNIIVVAMGSLHRLDESPVTHNMTDEYHASPNSTITWLGVTHDGGRTWKIGELPILDHKKFTRCPDSFAAVTSDGTFLAGCEPRETTGDFFGGSYLVISHDKGEHWSPPVDIISSYDAARFAPGLKPRIGGNSPWDRPFLRIDDSTGVIYGQAGGGETDIDQKPGVYRIQSYITASTDRANSFGTIYAWDSKEYPQTGRGDFDAAQGVVAVVYTARSAPSQDHAACPCTVWGLSHDQGKTFQYRVLANVPAAAPRRAGDAGTISAGRPGGAFPGSRPGAIKLAANQKKGGEFALLIARDNRILVATTHDYGKSWSDWSVAGEVPNTQVAKPWMAYSRDGVLALMWRAIHPDGSYDIWSSASREGEQGFRAVRVSHASSPFRIPDRDDGWFGDDVQDLVLDSDNVHMVWGDSRAGFLGSWYGRIPLSAYESSGAAGGLR